MPSRKQTTTKVPPVITTRQAAQEVSSSGVASSSCCSSTPRLQVEGVEARAGGFGGGLVHAALPAQGDQAGFGSAVGAFEGQEFFWVAFFGEVGPAAGLGWLAQYSVDLGEALSQVQAVRVGADEPGDALTCSKHARQVALVQLLGRFVERQLYRHTE